MATPFDVRLNAQTTDLLFVLVARASHYTTHIDQLLGLGVPGLPQSGRQLAVSGGEGAVCENQPARAANGKCCSRSSTSARSLMATVVLVVIYSPVLAAEPVEVRVGLLAYEDFVDDLPRYEAMFGKIAHASATPLHFRFAVGTYGDVAYWLDRGDVDLAVVSPGVFADAFAWDGKNSARCDMPTSPR